jgi:hypothetical protein
VNAQIAARCEQLDRPHAIQIHFYIKQPIAGTYDFVVIDEANGESAPQTIVVPSAEARTHTP